MKRIINLILFLFISICTFSQTDGISYQAVIIGPDDLELPGVDSEGNYLPSATISLRFTILTPGSDEVHYTEIQTTTTDDFGRINLIIGSENHDDFEKIDWNGVAKSLKVEVDFQNGDGFVDMSIEKLTYVPYVAHRDITATGTLKVDDDTFLNRELTVNGPTTLNSTLDVTDGNPVNFSGDLNVDGITNLNNTLNVTGQSASNLSGALNVGDPSVGPPDGDPNAPTVLNGSLTVVGESTFTGLVAEDLTINESTELNGSVAINSDAQITITSTLSGDDDTDINNYPLKIEGGEQGIAIVVNESRTNDNNFISFWDNTSSSSPALSEANVTTTNPTMWGRIEGETPGEFENDADYLFDQRTLRYDILDASMDLLFQAWDTAVAIGENIAAATAVAPCIGPIPCVMGPPPSWIVSTKAKLVAEGIKTAAAIANEVVAINHKVIYDNNREQFQGVTYASGAGDYAEYLLRENIGEKMTYGDIVGVKGGKISKDLTGAERIMVVSYKPIVLGNMPQEQMENQYEKVAFMGQVPVKVFGKANIGDYIVPSGKNDGIGIAISPSDIKVNQIKDIVGTAWDVNLSGFNVINVAVGLNRNDSSLILEKLEDKVNAQAQEISNLKRQMDDILATLSNINESAVVVNKGVSVKSSNDGVDYQNHTSRKVSVVKSPETDIIYFEINEQDLEAGLALAKKMMEDSGEFERSREIFEKLENNPEYKKRFIGELQSKIDKQLHYHKEIDKKGKF
ncbi:Peptidase_G2, IMC autoproteolytic cleavage domain [Hyunsoonleella jejuensis]|uniref:Peptidase_G2, IMC autoproteolytic cleavage domain n=1 Tax=Hyunsoonleella jejuensis TaxID=419940 RepID=A0A1H9H4X4_9FLAO|nr:peptidase G2 autoproteolytic cleavage domain-containing protein [Hyunsoonleella jejuensis]SEQ57343.1 Peptidase_G2, IMC autoproteolytic cleavage domain [Hyunsoonleella jejuensis]